MQIDDFKNLTLADKKRVLAQMQAQSGTVQSASAGDQRHPKLVRDTRTDDQPFPLTDLQGAYLAAKVNPIRLDKAGCHVYLEFEVEALDPARLERAWSKVVTAHSMLRAEILANGSHQRIDRERALPSFRREDHSTNATAAHECVERIRRELSHKLYRPGDWPLYEIRVTDAPQGRSRVHVSMDSWIVDAKSAEQIYRQWRACYDQPGLALEAPALEFRDFVHSMEAFKTSVGYARCLAYWKDRLADCPDGPTLPYSAQMQQAQDEQCNRHRLAWQLPAPAFSALQAAFSSNKLSPTAGILTLFCEALRGWCDRSRFGLILTMQNRPPMHADLASVVGPFTSTALFDAGAVDGETLTERAQRYGSQLLEALNNGYVSAVAALRSLGPGGPVRNFPIVFTSLLGATPSSQEPSWIQAVDYSVAQTPGTALHCQLRDINGELEITFDCVPSWFTAGFLEQFQAGFNALLNRAAADHASWELCSAASVCAPQLPVPSVAMASQRSVPMSALQRGYLAERMRQLDRASGYILRSFVLERLQPSAMQTALDGLLADHPMLRAYPNARGALECGEAVAYYRIPLTQLEHGEPDLEAENAQLLRQFAAERQWPGLRLHMIVRPDGSGYLLSVLDMAGFDGHSSWAFYEELFQRYLGLGATREASLWKPYLVARAAHAEAEVQSRYWLNKFAGLAAGPDLPPAVVDGCGSATVRWSYTVRAAEGLEQLAVRHRVSLESVLLAAYAAVLVRDGAPFAIGMVDYAHRQQQPGLMHGFGDATRFAWIETANPQRRAVLALARDFAGQLERDRFHACADPFLGLRGALAQDGEMRKRSVVLTNCLESPAAHWPGISVLDAASDTPGVDVDNMVHRSPQGVTLCWTVRRDSCDLESLSRSFDAYCAALDMLATDSDAWQRPVAMPQTEEVRTRLEQLARWNATDRHYDRNVCMHTLFERQARATPYAVAVLSDDEVLTYQELDLRASRLANYLQRQGVQRSDLVAVMLSRSNQLIVALLAILKCGAAFIPLNIDDPVQRLERVLDKADADVVISTRDHYRSLANTRRVLLLDVDALQIAQQPAQFAPAQPAQAEDRAYVIFTSGSTGTPKGVVVRHRPVINLIEWAAREFDFTPNDRVLFVNPLSFDLAIFDLFGLLAYGGSIRIVNDADRVNALAVAQYLRSEPITFWNSAPAYLQMVLPFLQGGAGVGKGDGPTVIERLRLVFLSGDWIPLAMPDAMRAVAPQADVISLGGATEATVWSNYFRVHEIDPEWHSIPYGRPIQNSRYYVLDEQLEPLAVGEAGDLYIGGECLSDGYINEPELTGRSFVSDPLHETPGAIMYRTGDRARFFADGNIEFLGRIDQQVKLRGYRIELGEVEAALAACGLARAIAVVRDDVAGRRLVGFAAGGGDAAGVAELRDEGVWQQIRARLPAYMVPSQVYVLPALPITANGKVDRKKLGQDNIADILNSAAPDTIAVSPSIASPIAAAVSAVVTAAGASTVLRYDRHQLETRLANWLCAGVIEVYGPTLASIALDDNLGYLGFNSLHYTMLAAKLANELDVALNPALFFRYVSVAEILDYLLQQHADQLAKVLLPATPSAVAVAPVATADSHDAVPPVAAPAAAPQSCDGNYPEGAIAIIGMAGVMPQAHNLDAFWANLQQGLDCTSAIPEDRWDWRTVDGDPHGPGNFTNVHRAAFMADVASFDAAFFSISPREAELMDPRQRMLLESVWACLENGGQRPSALRGSQVGIYIGATGDEYAALSLQPGREIDRFTLSGVSRTILSNRISYMFDWHGPSEVVDTACSSSLVAVHNAVRALQAGDCTMAIAGGINIMIDPVPHVCLNKIGMLAADGRCKTFDARADGYARGEGVGLVLLKPLADAIRDGDPVHAVLRGSAINHGGRATALSAPNPAAQVQVIGAAIRAAGIDCGQLGYMEAHGTGTALGDPIEIEALKETFGNLRSAAGQPPVTPGSVALSSVKPNVGHLESAAGIAGLLKALLSVKHGVLPATLHLEQLNPNIELADSPFYIVREAKHWESRIGVNGAVLPRAAGISSFGFGGVNAHVIVEQYLPAAVVQASSDGAMWTVPLSAQTEAQLKDMSQALAVHIETAAAGTLRLSDVAYTLQTARDSMQERLLLRAATLQQLAAMLHAYAGSDAVPADAWRGAVKSAPMRLAKAVPDIGVVSAVPDVTASTEVLAQHWTSNGAAAWPLWPAGAARDARRIALPTYRFARTPFWLPALAAPATGIVATEGAGSGSRVGVSVGGVRKLLPDCSTGDRLELLAGDPVLQEHQIAGQGVLPAAAYLAMLLRQDAQSRPAAQGWPGFGDIVWMQPFMLAEGKRLLRIEVSEGRHGSTRHELVSEDAGNRIEHCNAELLAPVRPSNAGPANWSYAGPANGCQLSQTECYVLFEQGGIRLGALYRTVQQLRFDAAGATAQLRCASQADDSDARWLLTLDGALQAIALHQQLTRPGSLPSVPFHVRRVYLVADCPTQSVVQLQLHVTANGFPSRIPKYDARLFDTEGRQIGWIEGCAGKALSPATPAAQPSTPVIAVRIAPQAEHPVVSRALPAHHYVPKWREFEADAALQPAAVRGMLLQGGQSVAEYPEVAPAGWIMAQRRPVFAVAGPAAYSLDPSNEADWESILVAADAMPDVIMLDYRRWGKTRDRMAAVTGVTLYQPFDEAFALARVAMRLRLRLRQTLTVVALTDPQSGSFSGAAVQALGAFGRAVSSESPKVRFCVVEILDAPNGVATDLAALAQRLVVAQQAGVRRPVNYRYHPQTRQLSAEHLEAVDAMAPATAALPAGSVVLISGGGGGIGRLVASFLLARGCRVALLGRTDTAEAQQQMRAAGLRDNPDCRYLQADVTDAEQVERAVAQVRAEWGPLRAVLHAAGARADGLLLRKDSTRKRVVLDAKVRGALVLDYATRNEPLDYFVSFSSLASYMGPVGQTDYAYANAFLNSFSQSRNQQVRERRRSGLSCAVGWPLWRDGGMRMDDKERDYIRQLHGLEEMATDAAMQCLFAILGGEHENIALAVGDKDKIDRALLGNPAAA